MSSYQKNKIKKALKSKQEEVRDLDYTISSNFKKIELQINEIKKEGFTEENIRAVLSSNLKILIKKKNILKGEIQKLETYLAEDDDMKELDKLERKERKDGLKGLLI